jgi:diguanylate cyclase (GGDEF)-like protein/PAS domain S-box-containing protein
MQLKTSSGRRRVLHVSAEADITEMVRRALTESTGPRYGVDWVGNLADGLERLATFSVSAVILDLHLPDCTGLDGLDQVLRAVPGVPVVMVGADESETVASLVIRAGAADYLAVPRLDGYWLPRLLRHAIDGKRAEVLCSDETARVESALNAIGDAVVTTDNAGRVMYLNRAAEAMTGWTRTAASGRHLEQVLRVMHGETREAAADLMEQPPLESENPDRAPHRILMRPDGSEVAVEHNASHLHNREGLVIGTAIVVRDVDAARTMSLRMSHQASHDPLTDLPNRLLLGDRLGRAIALARRQRHRLAVLFLDVDHFKHINDSLGHLLGDDLLRSIAREITMSVRSSDTVSRHGGDEFVVVLSELRHAEDAAIGAQKIMAALAKPHTLSDHDLHVTVSLGISVYPDDGEDAETLLKCADTALYHAKEQGRNGYRFFKPVLNQRAIERQTIIEGLRRAVENREFELMYQPTVQLKTGAIVGVEALLRWRHPQRGLLEPGQFVSIAEDSGLIRTIGGWVVHEACRQAHAWQAAGLGPIPVSVNISTVEFASRAFLPGVLDSLSETGLSPGYLELELTESALMANVGAATETLTALTALGVGLAIDDFGTGLSSLSYLTHFPIHALKIDRSFVHEISAGSAATPIVIAAISLGKSLRYRVIAEGIETREQLGVLQAEGCDEGQGYYFSRPLAAQQVAQVLETGLQPAGDVVSDRSSRSPRILSDLVARSPAKTS